MASRNENSLPPPPYSESATDNTNFVESPMEDFLLQSQQAKHRREAETLRTFLLCMLQIDYNLNAHSQQNLLLHSDFAIYLNDFFILHEKKFGAAKRREATELFLAQFPEAVESLNVRHELLCHALENFRRQAGGRGGSSKDHQKYRSLLDSAPIDVMAKKLWVDGTEYIDALVRPEEKLLRLGLRAGLKGKQHMYFDFIKGEEDYELTLWGMRLCEKRLREMGSGGRSGTGPNRGGKESDHGEPEEGCVVC